MSKDTTFHADIDRQRDGFAGVHDLIGTENINRTMKRNEVLSKYSTIFLPVPEGYVRGSHRMLLVQGPHDEREGTAIFPLGLGYIARVLHDIGVGVDILDAHAERLSPEQTLDEINRRDYDLVGITALSTQYGFVKWLSAELKERRPDVKIILGAQLAHYNAHTVIEHTAVDVCVIGEGEVTIQDVIYNLDDLSGVAGIAYRDASGQYRRNPDRPRIANPDAIPFPMWEAFNLDHYFTTGAFGMRAKRAINMLACRGCPYSCTFCSLSLPNVTYRSVDNIIAEIKELQERYGVTGIIFADELFVIDKKKVYAFCEKVKPLGITWGGQGRANVVNDDVKLLQTMKDAGCCYIGYGLESATSEMLSKMQKKTTLQQNINCVKAAQQVGLVVVAQYMFGFPGETIDTIRDGVQYFKTINYAPPLGAHSSAHIALTTPLPGSQLYEDCRRSGMIVDEDEYLSRISRGYFYNKGVIVNLTSFTDDELLDLKYAAQEVMMENHLEWLRGQGRIAALRRMLKTLFDIYYFEGIWHVLKQVALKTRRVVGRFAVGDRRGRGFWAMLYPESTRTDYIYRTQSAVQFKKALSERRPSPEMVANRERLKLEITQDPPEPSGSSENAGSGAEHAST